MTEAPMRFTMACSSVGRIVSSNSAPLASASPTFVVTSVGICTPVIGSVTTPAACRSTQAVSNTVALKRSLPSARSVRRPTSKFSSVDGWNGTITRVEPIVGADAPPEGTQPAGAAVEDGA